MPKGRQAVLPADLLALGVVAARVGDRHFVDPALELGDLDRDLGLEPETARLEAELSQDVPRKTL